MKKYIPRRFTLEKVNKRVCVGDQSVVLRDEETGRDLAWYQNPKDCPEELLLCDVEKVFPETRNGDTYQVVTISNTHRYFFKYLLKNVSASIVIKAKNAADCSHSILTFIDGSVKKDVYRPWLTQLHGLEGYNMCAR